MGATLEVTTNEKLKELINDIEAKLDNGTYGLSALNVDLDLIISLLGTPAGASLAADLLDIENKLDNPTFGLAALNADLNTLLASQTVTEIENESVWTATVGVPLIANQEYPILEVLVTGSVIYVYRYNFAAGTVPAVPTETLGRTEITHFDGDVFELSMLFININKAVNGIWTRMAASDTLYVYAKYYDTTASAFVLVPDIVRRDKAVDTLITAPPIQTDLGEGIVFDGAKLQLASRFILYFYNDANITSEVNIPFTFGIRRAR